eukprot:2702386-Pleurochrysis_carterae.AAC.1
MITSSLGRREPRAEVDVCKSCTNGKRTASYISIPPCALSVGRDKNFSRCAVESLDCLWHYPSP